MTQFQSWRIDQMSDLLWFVAHTRSRCEKKLQQFCVDRAIPVTLPCYKTVRRYQRKTVTFEKPLFPGYVFLQLVPGQSQLVAQNDCVANLLTVIDQNTFDQQITEILGALKSGVSVFLAPEIGVGTRVRIKSGPLRGLEGWVEERYGPTTVMLRLDFIGQAAGLRLPAENFEAA
jgi:transcription antitermination factor NusG